MLSSARIMYQIAAFSLAANFSSLGNAAYSSGCCFPIIWVVTCYQETRLGAQGTAQLDQASLPFLADDLCVLKDCSPTQVIG